MKFPTEPIRWDRGFMEPIATGIEYDADGRPCRIYLSPRSPRRKPAAEVVRHVRPSGPSHFQPRLFQEPR